MRLLNIKYSLLVFLVCLGCSDTNSETEKDGEQSRSDEGEDVEMLQEKAKVQEALKNTCDCMTDVLDIKKPDTSWPCIERNVGNLDPSELVNFRNQLKPYMLYNCVALIEKFNELHHDFPWIQTTLDSMKTPNCDSIRNMEFLEFDYESHLNDSTIIEFKPDSEDHVTREVDIDECSHYLIIMEVLDDNSPYQVGDTLLRTYAGQYKNYVLIEDVFPSGAETKTLYKISPKEEAE